MHFGPNGSQPPGCARIAFDLVAAATGASPRRSPTPAVQTPPPSAAAPAPVRNFRDVGGLRTRDGGTVRRGLLYRSTDFARSGPGVQAVLAERGIRTIFDLRTAGERELWPETGRFPADVSYVVADVLRDARGPDSNPAQMVALLADPDRAAELLGAGRAEPMFRTRYRDFVNLTSARQAYHRVLADLSVRGTLPAVVHCTTGKDRTGWILAVLLLMLGVAYEDVLDDYLASNAELEPIRREFYDQFAGRGGDPELLKPFMEARPAYLDTGLDEMRRGFGSLEGYVDFGLAIGPLTQRRLASIFVEPA
ncbi:MAG TPA: tyrosine-protein phosphatase [Candidatus Deferrimicrobiaceae bacterium]|nr:tyrosine-protein phosphatase [Candidatus Deferrimicrobiaceae bacterium]